MVLRSDFSLSLSIYDTEEPSTNIISTRHALMISRYDDAYSMLDLAQDIGMSLQNNTPKEQLDSNPELRDELDTLVRRSYHHRGCIGLHVNQPDISLTNHLKFTQLLREKLGDNPKGKDQSLGVAWNELGNAYLQNKRWGEGVSCFKKSIRALECLEGSTRITISMPLISLAFAYWLEGQLDQAYSTFGEALLDRENEYGVDDTSSFV
jgi:tetratricopeptide (TPR) repeat protein